MAQRTVLVRRLALLAVALLTGSVLASCSSGGSSPAVLLVGTYHGMAGQYSSIQAAVNAAQTGDFILVAPGDYHESDDAHVTSASQLSTGDHGGVVVHTSNLTIRGMNRDTVIVDGTKAGAPVGVQRRPAVPELRPGRRGQGPGPQRHRGVEGRPREHREPHRLQLPRWRRRLGERGLVERRRRVGEGRPHRVHRELPDRDHVLLRATRPPRRSTGSSPPTRRARPAGTRSTAPT